MCIWSKERERLVTSSNPKQRWVIRMANEKKEKNNLLAGILSRGGGLVSASIMRSQRIQHSLVLCRCGSGGRGTVLSVIIALLQLPPLRAGTVVVLLLLII